jgi:hypothetical protein
MGSQNLRIARKLPVMKSGIGISSDFTCGAHDHRFLAAAKGERTY